MAERAGPGQGSDPARMPPGGTPVRLAKILSRWGPGDCRDQPHRSVRNGAAGRGSRGYLGPCRLAYLHGPGFSVPDPGHQWQSSRPGRVLTGCAALVGVQARDLATERSSPEKGARQVRRDLASGGRAVCSQHRRAPRPAATSRPVTPHRVGGRHRATPINGITLSNGVGQGERTPSRRYGRHQGFAGITFDPRLSGGSVSPVSRLPCMLRPSSRRCRRLAGANGRDT